MNGYPESVMERWDKWNKENPNIYRAFRTKAWHIRAVGHDRYSARRIVESMRWDSDLMGTKNPFLINSDFVPIMARKFVKENPGTENFFEFREVRSRGIKSSEQRKREALV
jgi:L-2-hydroxyglutarate oxidase LhgO